MIGYFEICGIHLYVKTLDLKMFPQSRKLPMTVRLHLDRYCEQSIAFMCPEILKYE